MESSWYTTDNYRFHVREGGDLDQPTVVVVHGWTVSSSYMRPLLRHLETALHVLAPDLPGFGRTKASHILTTEELAGALTQFLDVTDANDVTLVCHSYSCEIAAVALPRIHKRVRRLVLIGATGDPTVVRVRSHVLRILSRSLSEPLWFWIVAFVDLLRAGIPRALITLTRVGHTDIAPLVAQWNYHPLILRGIDDQESTSEWAHSLAEQTSGTVEEIDGAAHVVTVAQPGAVAAAVRRFSLT